MSARIARPAALCERLRPGGCRTAEAEAQRGMLMRLASLRPPRQMRVAAVALVCQQSSVVAEAQHGAADADSVSEKGNDCAKVPETVQADRPQAGDAKNPRIQGPFQASAVLPEGGGHDSRPKSVTEWR